MDQSQPSVMHNHGGDPTQQTARVDLQASSLNTAFESQYPYAGDHYPQSSTFPHQYTPNAFDMATMASALPYTGRATQYPTYGQTAPTYGGPAVVYPMMPPGNYPPQHGQPYDTSAGKAQQQPFLPPQYPPTYPLQAIQQRHFGPNATHHPYGRANTYGYPTPGPAMPVHDPRYSAHGGYGVNYGIGKEHPNPHRRVSETTLAPVPSFPRGPPRKPRQSGHALWVGNLPPTATVSDLKDHFSRDATRDIESVFLISKSNCAFVNYRTDEACVAAMGRFHDSRFHGIRLVCRLRRGPSTTGDTSPSKSPSKSPSDNQSDGVYGEVKPKDAPIIVASDMLRDKEDGSKGADSADDNDESNRQTIRTSEKYFIVKSLTAQDLEASVRNGTWATQSHNEAVLNDAYSSADNVYLIFSANRSGEYFGYARMSSAISGDPVDLTAAHAPLDAPATRTASIDTTNSHSPVPPPFASAGAPQSIPTPATETAPRGRIIDDSARGTIFWEAEHSDDESATGGSSSPEKEGSGGEGNGISGTGQNWGRQFRIEWLSTTRLPFYRTRGLRNPWNANREVKIARDGTELEPGVGQRLIGMFNRNGGGVVQGGGGAVGVMELMG